MSIFHRAERDTDVDPEFNGADLPPDIHRTAVAARPALRSALEVTNQRRRTRLHGHNLAAPELIDLEVAPCCGSR